MKVVGAVEQRFRARPLGILTKSPFISAPASFHKLNANSLSGNFTPISERTSSALFSMISKASSLSISKFGIFLSMYLENSIC